MRTVIQRVSQATVTVDGRTIASIRTGLLILLGITDDDSTEDILHLAGKIINLRIFNDDNNIMNKSVIDIGGEIILVSQFTLYASTKKGNRPSYTQAAKPETAIPLYEQFRQTIEKLLGKPIQTGRFGADMKITLTNDGPVTICIDTKNKE